MKTLQSRLYLAKQYIKNQRLKEYEKIIKYAIERNYVILSVHDYFNELEVGLNQGGKYLVLRHDIDQISPATVEMAEVERKYITRASYYFRRSTQQEKTIRRIISLGHEASIHFENISDYIKKYGIKTKEELLNTNFEDVCISQLTTELENFRKRYDVPCRTIAAHGEKENRIVGVANNYLTEKEASYLKLSICLEVYDKSFIESFQVYISDTVQEINGGYTYGLNPHYAIGNGMTPILFLTHPNHWKYTLSQTIKKVIKVLIFGSRQIPQEFKRL